MIPETIFIYAQMALILIGLLIFGIALAWLTGRFFIKNDWPTIIGCGFLSLSSFLVIYLSVFCLIINALGLGINHQDAQEVTIRLFVFFCSLVWISGVTTFFIARWLKNKPIPIIDSIIARVEKWGI